MLDIAALRRVTSAYCISYKLGWGFTLLIALFLLSGVYLLVGINLGKRSGKRPDGNDQGLFWQVRWHPHFERWKALRGLVRDGTAFARANVQGKASGRIAPSAREEQLLKHKKDPSRRRQKGTNERGSQSGRTERGRHTVCEGANNEQAPPSEASDAHPDVVAGTPAGGGGRWVHVT